MHFPSFQWHHFVLVKKLDTMKLYVNGEKIFAREVPHNVTTAPLFIGTEPHQIQNWNKSFDGLIDETKLFNVALSDSQVVALFNQDYSTISQSVGILKGNVYIDQNRTASAIPLKWD